MAGRKQTATMELAIGATIIAGVILLIVMLMAWGNSISFLGRHYRVVVNMLNVGGLKEGAPVRMGGFQIGRVASIQIRPGGTDMEIVLDIDESRILPRGSTAKVATAGLVGDAFMNIIPGKSTESIKRATIVADAERIEGASVPDPSELFDKVSAFGDQLTILTNNLNDILGDQQFRRSVKSLAVNIDAVSHQANLILQRGQNVVGNIEVASQNVAVLSTTLKGSIEKATDDIEEVTDAAKNTMANLNKTIADIHLGVNGTLGNKKLTDDLIATVANIKTVTKGLADRQDATNKTLENLGDISDDLKKIAGRVNEITTAVDPRQVADAVNAISGAINSLTDVVERIKAEPVLALSVNKAADRIVKMKFDEMSRQSQFRASDAVLQEINRWVEENMKRRYFQDPKYEFDERPYVVDR